jgi:hypothetical protein
MEFLWMCDLNLTAFLINHYSELFSFFTIKKVEIYLRAGLNISLKEESLQNAEFLYKG